MMVYYSFLKITRSDIENKFKISLQFLSFNPGDLKTWKSTGTSCQIHYSKFLTNYNLL